VQPIYDDPPTGSFSEGYVGFAWRRGQIAHAIHSGILSYFTPVGTMHVAAIETGYVKKGPNYTVFTKVSIVDEKDIAVSGAAVSLEATLPDGSIVSDSGKTADDGTVTFNVRMRQTGTYSSTVTDVSKEEWVYDETANAETSNTLTVR
jgi:hypothetical protein